MMDVMCVLDGRYQPFFHVLLRSLLDRLAPGQPLHIHLLVDRIDEGFAARCRASADTRDVRFSWRSHAEVAADDPGARDILALSPHYHRLLIDRVVPPDRGQALYLDVDLMFMADATPLLQTMLPAGVPLGACVDYFPTIGRAVANHAALGLRADLCRDEPYGRHAGGHLPSLWRDHRAALA